MGSGFKKNSRQLEYVWSDLATTPATTKKKRKAEGLVKNNAICNLKDVSDGSSSRTSRTVTHTRHGIMIYSSRGKESFKVAQHSRNISVRNYTEG